MNRKMTGCRFYDAEEDWAASCDMWMCQMSCEDDNKLDGEEREITHQLQDAQDCKEPQILSIWHIMGRMMAMISVEEAVIGGWVRWSDEDLSDEEEQAMLVQRLKTDQR